MSQARRKTLKRKRARLTIHVRKTASPSSADQSAVAAPRSPPSPAAARPRWPAWSAAQPSRDRLGLAPPPLEPHEPPCAWRRRATPATRPKRPSSERTSRPFLHRPPGCEDGPGYCCRRPQLGATPAHGRQCSQATAPARRQRSATAASPRNERGDNKGHAAVAVASACLASGCPGQRPSDPEGPLGASSPVDEQRRLGTVAVCPASPRARVWRRQAPCAEGGSSGMQGAEAWWS